MPSLWPVVKGATNELSTLPAIGSMVKMLAVGGVFQEAIHRSMPSKVRSRALELGAVRVLIFVPV